MDKPCAEQLESVTKNISSDNSESCISQNLSSSSWTDAQRCMSLYFAMCTEKHSLFREIFCVYKSTSNTVKKAIHCQIPILVRTIGSSSELLETISDPPTGSEHLLMQVLNTLTDGTVPSLELILTLRKLYTTKVKILVPMLSYLPKDEVLLIFPRLVYLPLDKFQAALGSILQGSSHSGQVLSPAEVLIAIHGIDPDRDGIVLKKVTDACNACFEQRQIFTQQVLAKVLNQLVECIMEILSRLVNKLIWKYPKLWVGFLKCAQLTKPQSFGVLLQGQAEFTLSAETKSTLSLHPATLTVVDKSVLAVLGIASEPQNSSQVQSTPANTRDVGDSDKEAVPEKSKESSSAN